MRSFFADLHVCWHSYCCTGNLVSYLHERSTYHLMPTVNYPAGSLATDGCEREDGTPNEGRFHLAYRSPVAIANGLVDGVEEPARQAR